MRKYYLILIITFILFGFSFPKNNPKLSLVLPEIYFYENSVEVKSVISGSGDTITLDSAYSFLMVVSEKYGSIEIDGFCDSREKNKIIITDKRIQLIFNGLINKGVPKNKITFKNYSDTFPICKVEMIKSKINNKKEIDRCRQLNRSLRFKIYS